MIDTDRYEGHTENKWEWYEFGDGDWILCPLFDGVKANEDDMWWVDENGKNIDATHDIFNWDESILSLASECRTANRGEATRIEDFSYCCESYQRLPRKRADMNLIQDAPLLLEAYKRLREQIELMCSLGMGKDGIETIVVDRLNAQVKRLREEVKVLSKYRDIVTEFDDALLADGDTDIRWSDIYDERVFE